MRRYQGVSPSVKTSRSSLPSDSHATNPASYLDMIDLFTAATMNGRRAALALAECSLAHRVHRLDLNKMDQRKPEFLAINSRGTIPVIVDASGPGGTPITVTQSAAIVLYCAEKSGKLMPHDPQRRIEALDWFMHAVTDLGPASSALFQLSLAPEKSAANVRHFEQRFLKHCTDIDTHLLGRSYLAGEFSIADIALYPVVLARTALVEGTAGLVNLKAWQQRIAGREQTVSAMAANG
jgi:GSH-dependent disulfide-bond oxidoreductase